MSLDQDLQEPKSICMVNIMRKYTGMAKKMFLKIYTPEQSGCILSSDPDDDQCSVPMYLLCYIIEDFAHLCLIIVASLYVDLAAHGYDDTRLLFWLVYLRC